MQLGDIVINIRRIVPNEYEIYRSIRLKSLQEDPYAYSTKYDEANKRANQSWIDQVNEMALSQDVCAFLVFDNQEAIGLCGLYRNRENKREGEIVQVWINNAYRSCGIAKEMITKIMEWAKDNKINSIIAKVYLNNPRAIRFYEKIGFESTEIANNEKVLQIIL